MTEATHKRSKARGHLFREEKSALLIANSRERQTLEGRRLVNSRKQELEFLEKKMIEAQKVQTQSETLGENDVQTNEEDEISDAPQPPQEVLEQAFEVLKKATGATNADEVLEKFSAQKDTFNRLVLLRQEAEDKKKKLEKEVEQLNAKLEYYKYAEAKETEKKTSKMEQIQDLIDKERLRSKKALAMKTQKDQVMQKILLSVRDLHRCVNPLAIPSDSILAVLIEITNDLNKILEKNKQQITEDVLENADVTEEKWLPAPYSGLVRRTPLPQAGVSPAPPPPPTSDDEEEVPSRCYLKRQAQLVVDAKSRRKNVRMQPPKRN